MREVDPEVRTCLAPYSALPATGARSTRQPVVIADQLVVADEAIDVAEMVLLVFMTLFIREACHAVNNLFQDQTNARPVPLVSAYV